VALKVFGFVSGPKITFKIVYIWDALTQFNIFSLNTVFRLQLNRPHAGFEEARDRHLLIIIV